MGRWAAASASSAQFNSRPLASFAGNPPFHISVRSFDELRQRDGVNVALGTQFHMAHEFAGAFQQTLRIGKLGAAKETDVNVSLESIHVGEGGIAYTRGRMAIV